MSKMRVVVLVCVFVLGAAWFFSPTKNLDPKVATVSVDQSSVADSDNNSGGAVSVDSLKSRKIAQSSSPAAGPSATSSGSGGSAPGDAALRAFQAESVRPWTVRRTGSANGIKTLVRGLWTSGNASDSMASAEAFVHDYSESLLGVPADEVKFLRQEETDRTKIVYEQNVNGVPVYGGTLVLFFENGGMSRVQSDLFAKSPTLSRAPADFDSNQAFAKFNSEEGSTYVNLSNEKARTILYPGPTALVYAYEISVRDTTTRKTYRVLYNAEDRALIKKFPSQIQ